MDLRVATWWRIGALVALLTTGCDERPRVALDDSGVPWIDSGPAFRIDPSHTEPPGSTVDLPAWAADADGGTDAGRTSPPACPGPDDRTFCEDCYRWTDFGPDSLGRNRGGESFGYVSSGDFNEDGYPDLAVGAPEARDSDPSDSGGVFVYLGSAHGFLPFLRVTMSGVKGLGRAMAVTDVNGDGFADIAATYRSPGGGVAVFTGDGAGHFELALNVAAETTPGPGGGSLVGAEFGATVAAADFFGDGQSEVVVGAPGWGGIGAVLVLRADGSMQWITFRDAGGTASAARFGSVLAPWAVSGSAAEWMLAGAPESGQVFALLGHSGSVRVFGAVASQAGTPGFGRSIAAVRDAVAIAGDTDTVELFRNGFDFVALNHPSMSAVRPIALLDTNSDGNIEVFGTRADTTAADPLFVWFGVDAGGVASTLATLDVIPPRSAGDALGAQTALGDWNGDGYGDVAFGVPAPGSSERSGYVFGYYGAAEPRADEDNTLDFDDEYFSIHLETPACDRCRVLSLSDGAGCHGGFCLERACVPRTGCGDGWAESGDAFAREGCDDRNTEDGDSCSSGCVPTPFVVAARGGAVDEPGSDRAVALDGSGAALVVWTAHLETTTEVRARRYSRYGTELDAAEDTVPLVLASMPGPGADPQPAAAGRPGGGWRVVWTQPTGSEAGAVVTRSVALDGGLSDSRRVSGPTSVSAHDPAIAIGSDGSTIIAWANADDPSQPQVSYRWLDSTGASTGAPIDLGAGSEPAIAIAGTPATALIAWVQPAAELGFRSPLVGARVTPTSSLDSSPVVVAPDGGSPSIAADDASGEFVVAWVGRALDPEGDIYARRIPRIGAPVAAATRVTERDARGRAHAELRPSIALRSDGWIVAWEEPVERRARLAAEHALPPEYASYLEPQLTDGLQRTISLAGSPRGTWVIWSDARADLPIAALRATRGFILHAN